MDDLTLYFHWPLCLTIGLYCDFKAPVRGRIGQSRVASVLFGGDAPSLMDPQSMAALSNERRAACHENATPPPVTNRRMLVKGGAGNFSERQAAR